MSGDVQPRKRKDKRRRKDELGVEEPRGTAAVFGEGDVFMHSQHEHGTGGHWCAKVIFFSLLAVLVTLIGLIILENRGLSELEANSVESRYSGVLEGWLEDAPDDDHHDVHTLELKHHDEEEDEHDAMTDEEHDNDNEDNEETDDADEDDDETGEAGDEIDEDDSRNDDEDEENDEDNDSEDNADDEDQDQDDDDENQNLNSAESEEDDDERNFRKFYDNQQDEDADEDNDSKNDDDEEDNESRYDDDEDDENDNNNDDDDDDADDESDHGDLNDDETDGIQDDDENDDDSNEDNKSNEENVLNKDDESHQQLDDDDDDEDQRYDDSNDYEESYAARQYEEEGDADDDDLEDDAGLDVEKIEKEISDEDVVEEAAAYNVEEESKSAEHSDEETAEEDQTVDEEEFLEPEDIEEPVVVERITAPAGKPLPEVEEETSSEKPPDTLAEEEEYEKQQEELRRQREQASHLWLKVAVGGALLVATHAVIRRATAPRDPQLSAEHSSREETPSAIDRRMTLIPEEPSTVTEDSEEIPPPAIVKEVERISTATAKSVTLPSEKNEGEEDEELDFENENVKATEFDNDDEDKELYSDEDEIEEEVEQEVEVLNEAPKQSVPETKNKDDTPKEEAKTLQPEVEPDEEVPDDVEIIDDEQLEEELVEEEEEDEDDISDVDDAELLSRLEAKYGRLPDPDRPTLKKDGGNSLEDEWPGEPSDQYWRQQLDEAERELRQGSWGAAERVAGAAELRGSARARYMRARALDAAAEARRDNHLLSQAIAAYLELLKMNERLSDNKLLEVTNRTLNRIRFRGNYLSAEPIYRLLIRRFPDDPSHRNNLTIAFLMANRPDLAEEVLRETLRRWPDDRVALAHLGFILKTTHNKLEEAVDAMRKALDGDIGTANEPRFYFHLGDALLLLGRFEEAHEVHKRGAKLGHFLSPAQRSLYNVERLKSQPWWDVNQTPYARLARALEASWQTILKEGEAARALYEQEKEGLRERGEWSQLDLFVRGQELPGRCKKAPTTCSIVRQETAAVGCKRGQIKFSSMEAGTHVRPHVGPTNCRLRMHLGLSNTKDTYIRVDKETRQWQAGKVLMFDDSFEHEVWHNGTGSRLVLIVDVWHPDLTPAERRSLPAI